jgi:hypothetical protein
MTGQTQQQSHMSRIQMGHHQNNPMSSAMNATQQQTNMRQNNRFNKLVGNIVKKELQKRHESPRTRRQLINNIAMQGGSQHQVNQMHGQMLPGGFKRVN